MIVPIFLVSWPLTQITHNIGSVVELPLPAHGLVKVSMPFTWKETTRQTPPNLPPTLILDRSTSPRATLEITVLWSPKGEVGFSSMENVRSLTVSGQAAIRESAVERVLPLKPLQGAQGKGFYYSATDKNYKTPGGKPVPGEYPILTHGELGLKDVVVSFTLFSDAPDDAAVREALAVIQGATLGPR